MTPREELLRKRFNGRFSRLEPGVREELLRTFDSLADSIRPGEIERIINAGMLDDLLDESLFEQGFGPLRSLFAERVAEAARLMALDIPGLADDKGIFGILNPRVVRAVQDLDTKVFTGLKDEIRETVRGYVEQGLKDGVAPRTLARGLRETIGLAPNQEKAVHNFRAMLEEGRFREALSRKLRDGRFDKTLARLAKDGGTLTPEQIKTMSDAYRRRMIAFNAETHARTATLDALKQGQQLATAEAVDRGYLDGSRLWKRWRTVGDAKVRDEHVAMDGDVARWDETYSNGEMLPGESTYNCRCRSETFQVKDAETVPERKEAPEKGWKAAQAKIAREAAQARGSA